MIKPKKHKKQELKGDLIPIHQARNLGPKSAQILELIGVNTLKDLKDAGWGSCLEKIQTWYPPYFHLNMARALIGAIENKDWRKISKNDLTRARNFMKALRSGSSSELR